MADTGPNPKLNKDKKEPEYPTELESQFILRLPEEPAKVLRELLKTGDGIKNRLTIQIENDMRNGEVRLDHWLMHAKIIDLPTIVESLKTIDNKSFYKTADICQMMICKEEPDQTQTEEDTPSKNKKKDPYKVDKKFLWPHGLTPPTKNIRKRRFRKTLKKKFVEAPEIEKEVKRLLRADNEACELSWEVIKEDDDQHSKPQVITPTSSTKPEKKTKADRGSKKEATKSDVTSRDSSSNVVDIFGGAVSDSDAEDDTINVDLEGHMSTYDNQLSDLSAMMSISDVNAVKRDIFPTEFEAPLYHGKPTAYKVKKSSKRRPSSTVVSTVTRSGGVSSEEDIDYLAQDMSKDNMSLRIEQLRTELEELKQRRQRTQHEIAGMENQALRQRFQDVLHTLNQDVMYKEMEYQGLITLQNSEDI